MTERIIAYLLLLIFFFMDSFFRKDATSKSTEKTDDDNRSTVLILATFFMVLIVSIVLNLLGIGLFNNPSLARVGLALMIIGLMIRIHSMQTLQRFYTRTLLTVDQQELVRKGMYRIIRHPGYLGTILIWGAAGLAMSNWLVFSIGIVLVLVAYYYRIQNEERMLAARFGPLYAAYRKTSWRLIPFLW